MITSFVDTHLTCFTRGSLLTFDFPICLLDLRGFASFFVLVNEALDSLLSDRMFLGFKLVSAFSALGLWKTFLITIRRWLSVMVLFFLISFSFSRLNCCEYLRLFDVKALTSFSFSFCLSVWVDLTLDLITLESFSVYVSLFM